MILFWGRSGHHGGVSALRRGAALWSLLSWLGPWRGSSSWPHGVARETWVLRDGALPGRRGRRAGTPIGPRSRLEVEVFTPEAEPLGTYLVVPGLHFEGPHDPRLERFCRVLARSGFRVVAPTLPAYAELLVDRSAADDLELVARALVERLPTGERFTVFSISFGSWPALELAARTPDAVDAVVSFGGYFDFVSAVRFCVDGVMRTPRGDFVLARDPLNQPALFINMLPWLDVPGRETAVLAETWREMTYRTWGRMELKAPGRLEPFARALVERVPPEQRELFLVGCGVREGGARLVIDALERAGDEISFASPASALSRIRRPVVVCHGRDDDVIPWHEAERLADALSRRVPTKLLLTGLYGHTGAGRPSPGALASEGRTLLEIARTLAAGGRVADWVSRGP